MKIYVTGGAGAGKTTYAKYLSKKYKTPYLGLDSVKWIKKSDKAFTKSRTREERVKILHKFLESKSKWICDGVYNQDWVNEVLKNADLVLILHTPIWLRHYRCVKRALFKEDRKKLSLGALWKLLSWSCKYDKKYLPELKRKLDDFGVKYITIKSKDVDFVA